MLKPRVVRSVSRTRVSIIIKKFRENHTVQKKPGRGGKGKTSKTLGIKLVRDVSKETVIGHRAVVTLHSMWN